MELLPKFELRVINPDSDILPEIFGITESRDKELQKVIIHDLVDEKTWQEILQDVAKNCNHMNEFGWGMFLAGANWGRRKRNNPLSQLLGE